MLTVWGRKTSSNVQALMWCIGELGLAFERQTSATNTAVRTRRNSWR
jgi:hypothetical protein